MLGNCDKITTPISSTTKQWPQKQILLDDHKSLMASSSSSPPHKATMPPADHKHPLNCPRCDSSNTKFCYYNNYSLSQPRHFCKACKRYWTRGGTLRNVPVGGGCRKNKRPKRRDGISSSSAAASAAHPQIDLSPPSSHIQSPLFYGLPTNNNPLELNFPFSSFRVSSSSSDNAGFDLHPQINGLGLGFSSNNGFHDGMSNSSASPFSTAAANNSSLFFESSSSSSTMASLLASTLQHQKFAPKDMHAAGLMAFEDPQMAGMGKQVKGEGENRLAWNTNPNPNPHPNPNPIDQINSSDPSSLLWNTTSIGAWFDPSSIGSSVPSLI